MFHLRPILAAAALLACVAGSAEAHAATPPWRQIEPIVRRQLSKQLSRGEVKRLLANPTVREGLRASFEGWDGRDDSVRVRRDGRTLKVDVLVGERRRSCIDLGKTSETGDKKACEDIVEVLARRSLTLSRDLWQRPRRKKPPTPPEPPVPELDPDARPPSVLRRNYEDPYAKALDGMHEEVVVAMRGWFELRDRIGVDSRWRDPLEPEFRVGDPLPPVTLPEKKKLPSGSIEGNAMENLRYPFDESRMRLAWPLPDFFGDYARNALPPGDPIALPKPPPGCLLTWHENGAGKAPPRLECFVTALRSARLDRNTAYQVVAFVAQYIPLPAFKDIMAREVKKASNEGISHHVWALAWLSWAKRFPDRRGEEAAKLTAREQRVLRNRMFRWVNQRQYAQLRETMTALYERHFTALYPEARGRDGLPDPSRFADRYLWAVNWLFALDRVPEAQARTAWKRLAERERRLIGRLVSDARHAKRYPRVSRALRELASSGL